MALAQLEAAGAFDGPVERVAATSPPAALAKVRDGVVDGAVVPIESSVEGAVVPTLDSLALGDRLQIVAETELDVAFTILGGPGIERLDQVRTVRAYPVAAGQVRIWLEENCPGAEVQTASSNAGAAEDVANGLADAGRVHRARRANGSGCAASPTGWRTRRAPAPGSCSSPRRSRVPARTGGDRTSAVLEPHNTPGSLVGVLSEFATRGIDLIRIESRPVRTDPRHVPLLRRLHRAHRRPARGRGVPGVAPQVARAVPRVLARGEPQRPAAAVRRRRSGLDRTNPSGREGIVSGKLILVRHGQTEANVERRLDTRLPGARLTPRRARPGRTAGHRPRRQGDHGRPRCPRRHCAPGRRRASSNWRRASRLRCARASTRRRRGNSRTAATTSRTSCS